MSHDWTILNRVMWYQRSIQTRKNYALHWKEKPRKMIATSQLRLFIVEDLSRQVIELLGAHLDIEPAFFREHIVDYAWYNTRDRWVDPPNLNMVIRQNRWVALRFVTARYFKEGSSFQRAVKEAELFNVLRRPDDDQNNKSAWDDGGAIVGITRTRASFWLSSTDSRGKGAVGKCDTLWIRLGI
jgi:hypothetical protein